MSHPAWLGLTVKRAGVRGLILDYNPTSKEYTVEWETADQNLRRVTNVTHVSWDDDVPADPDVALLRRDSHADYLLFEDGYGWDVVSAASEFLEEEPTNLEGTQESFPQYFNEGELPTTVWDETTNTAAPGGDPSDPSLREWDPFHQDPAVHTQIAQNPVGSDNINWDIVPKTPRGDSSYPSMISKTVLGTGTCPECGDMMFDDSGHTTAQCSGCAHKEPIIYASNGRRVAIDWSGNNYEMRGDDSNPAIGGSGGYNAEHGDAPELLKDIDGEGLGTASYDVMHAMEDPEIQNRVKQVMMAKLAAFDYGLAEKHAGRKPKMCPFHADLVDYALEIGDPAAAVSSLSRHMYGPTSCKGQWSQDVEAGGHKCKYKPQMIKQEYWDLKEAEAEQRKLEREQQKALEPQPLFQPEQVEVVDELPNYEAPLEEPVAEEQWQEPVGVIPDSALETGGEPAGGDDHYEAPSIPSDEPMVSDNDYNPVADVSFDSSPEGEYVAPLDGGALMPVAASVLDRDGNEVKAGQVYELWGANDTVPDIVKVNNIADGMIQFETEGKVTGHSLQRSVKEAEFNDGSVMLVPHEHHPNAHGEVVPEEADNTATDYQQHNIPGPTDLSTGRNSSEVDRSHLAYLLDGADPQALVKEAGRDYSYTEQNQLINEQGSARNLDKLDLSGTHYLEDDELGDSFLF